MPRQRRRRNRRRNANRTVRRAGRRAESETASALTSAVDLHDILRSSAFPKKDKDGWLVIGKPGLEEKKTPDPVVSLRMLRAVFKADTPYRCRLGLMSAYQTSAAGAVNLTTSSSTVTSVAEWSSIDALFDEAFIHSFSIHFTPVNTLGGGIGMASAGSSNTIGVTSPSATTHIFNAGLIGVSLFAGAATYGSAAAMLSNPTRKQLHSGKTWVYTWKNNVRFDPHGLTAQNTAWQGWTLISNMTNYGGQIQIRAVNDATFGDGTNAITMGEISVIYDLSFRSRA